MTATQAPPNRGTTIHHAVVVTDEPPRVVSGKRAWFERWWVPCLILPMMMASDWKWRRRAAQEALGGSLDVQVLIELCVYIGIAVYLVLKYGHAPRLRRTTNLLFTMWAWAAIVFASAFYSVYPKLGIVRGVQLLIVAALAQTIASHATLTHMHRLAHGYLIMLSFAVASGYVYHGALNHAVAGRFHWLYIHPVPTGIYLMCGTVIACAYYKSRDLREVLNFWPRWVYGAVAGWIGLALILTKTRGSIAAAAVALIFLVLYHTPTRTKLAAGLLAGLWGIVIVVGLGPAILAYLERGNSETQLVTLNDRTNLWAQAFQKFTERPFTGYGLGSSRGIFLDTIGLGGGHNAFVNVMVDQGLIGLVAFVTLLGLIVWQLWRYPRGSLGWRESGLLLPLFVGLLVNATTAEFMAVPANNASLWLFAFCAWLSVISRAHASVDAAVVAIDDEPAPARAVTTTLDATRSPAISR